MTEAAHSRGGRLPALVLFSLAALLAASLVGLVLGASGVGVADVFALLSGGRLTGTARSILVSIRIPRVLGGLLAGAAFASSGALIQAVLDNPLASPNVIGVNSGAGMAVLLVAALASAGVRVAVPLPVAAFLGALVASGLILAVSSRAGVSRLTVVLAGVAVNAVFGAGMNFVLTVSPNAYVGSSSYLVGGLSGVVLGSLAAPAALIAVGLALALALAARINVLALGRETAHALGVRVGALRAAGLACLCGSRPLFDGFDLAVPRGKVLGVLGPNGCGKSTLLGLADGLGMPACGTVLVGGRPVAGLSARERAGRIALLSQVHRTPSMQVRDLVACGRYAHMGPFGQLGEKDERAVDDALSLMGLQALAHRNARRLSGGERQRAFIAMALAQEADVLLLDEPTTYLDVSAAHELMSLVRRLVAERGTTVVAVLHDIDLALRFCDEVAVLGRERPTRLLAQGSPGVVAGGPALPAAFGVTAVPCEKDGVRAYGLFAAEPPAGMAAEPSAGAPGRP